MQIDYRDKEYLLKWMQFHCYGYKNARIKRNILEFIQSVRPDLSDRYFRAIMSELKHENLISSTSSLGYWYNPLETHDRGELQAALASRLELKSRALDMLTNCDTQIKYWERKIQRIDQGQKELL